MHLSCFLRCTFLLHPFLSPAGFRITPPGSQCPGYFFHSISSIVTFVMFQIASFSITSSNKKEQQGLTVTGTGKLWLSLHHTLHVNSHEVSNFPRQKTKLALSVSTTIVTSDLLVPFPFPFNVPTWVKVTFPGWFVWKQNFMDV